LAIIDRKSPNRLEMILRDPGATSAEHELVLSYTMLTREEKHRVSLTWEHDAGGLSVAEEERMPGGDDDLL
jgi:hypothetical protein